MTRVARLLALLALLASPRAGALTIDRGAGDTFVLGCFGPPGIAASPSDPNLVFVACSEFSIGVFPHRVGPGGPIAPGSGPPFYLPADLNGAEPNPPAAAVIDDLWLFTDGEGWLTTSGHELVVPFDPSAGAAIPVVFEGTARLSVPTAWTLSGAFTKSNGQAISSFATNFTSGVLRVGGRLLVATSNFAQVGSNPVMNPGTVLLFDVAEDELGRLVVARADPAFAITSDPNPSALTLLPSGLVAVTNSGRIRLGTPPAALGPASVDLLDPASGVVVASIPLGNAGLAFRELALDASGSVAFAGSAVFRQLYAMDVRDAGELPLPAIDPRVQRPSCNGIATPTAGGVPCLPERAIHAAANPIIVPKCPACGAALDGYTVDVRFGAAGDFFVTTELNDGLVAAGAFDPRNLGPSNPLLPTRFGAVQSLVVTAPIGTFGQEYGPGPMILRASADGGLNGTTPVWLTLGPDGSLMRGDLAGTLATPTGDTDGDGVEDALDVCPVLHDPAQADAAGIGDAGPDGVGDSCQCGDVTGDGAVRMDDVVRIERAAAALDPPLSHPDHCNVHGLSGGGPGTCAADDADAIRSVLAGLASRLPPLCPPALP